MSKQPDFRQFRRTNAARRQPAEGRLAFMRLSTSQLLLRAKYRTSEPGTYVYDCSKRVIDIFFASLLIWIAIPLILVCGALIKLDSPGPVFFLQKRTGKGGRRFRLIKLRTMVANAPELKRELISLNKLSYPDFKMENDPRITKVGHFLRRTSLDEVPNLINVLAGHMSFVGPRPTSFAPDTYEVWQTARLRVLPGVTGLWQVSGRSDVDFDERVRLDIRYIEDRSLWTDMRLLAKTLQVVIDRKGAY